MGKIRHQAERAAFGKVVDSAMRHINKDREKSFLKIVDLTENFAKDRFRPESYEAARRMIQDPEGKWMTYVTASG